MLTFLITDGLFVPALLGVGLAMFGAAEETIA